MLTLSSLKFAAIAIVSDMRFSSLQFIGEPRCFPRGMSQDEGRDRDQTMALQEPINAGGHKATFRIREVEPSPAAS